MPSFAAIRVLPTVQVALFSATMTFTVLAPQLVQAQTTIPDAPASDIPGSVDNPVNVDNQELRPLAQGILSIQGGQQLMGEANSAISAQNYNLAVDKLQQARQIFNQLSNFYQELAGSFAGIDSRISETQRQQAAETAQMRDEATYQLALVHRAQNKPELAVPLLVQIVRSQNPTRDLGQKAYQQLLELGFVDTPYPRTDAPVQ